MDTANVIKNLSLNNVYIARGQSQPTKHFCNVHICVVVIPDQSLFLYFNLVIIVMLFFSDKNISEAYIKSV